MSRTPSRYPVFNAIFGIGVTVNDRIALIVVFKWLCFTGSWNMRKSLFFLFTGKTARIEPATSLFISHILSATPLWGSRLKMLSNKSYSSYCLLNSFFHHSAGSHRWGGLGNSPEAWLRHGYRLVVKNIRSCLSHHRMHSQLQPRLPESGVLRRGFSLRSLTCLLYTSDAADE